MPNLQISALARAYSDSVPTNAPLRQNFNWQRNQTISIDNPRSDYHEIPAGQSWTFFNGTQSTGIDGGTAFTVSNPFTSTYRFTHVSGTAPAFRTDRGLTLSTKALMIGVNADATALFTIAGATWGTVAEGDTIFLPGPVTGDGATPFSVLNQGFWTVLAVLSTTVLQVGRPTGTDFQGTNETQTIASNPQVQAFSATGIQAGDKMRISAGFATTSRRTYTVTQVTPSWVEVQSSQAIPLETSKVPGATGMIFYRNAAKFCRVESDQEMIVLPNGATEPLLQPSPTQAGDPEQVAWWEALAPIWKLTIQNPSTATAKVVVFLGE